MSNETKNQNTSSSSPSQASQSVGFGTFKGVFVPSILTILGVIMFLRLGWVVGHVGIIGAITIITLSSMITFVTGLSIASTATNMEVKGGGAYYMVSRSFGLEAGAAIGIPLFLAQALGISFYISGFAESLTYMFPGIPIQTIGMVSLVCLSILAYISADLALKAQIFIFILILVSITSFFLGKPLSGVPLPDSASTPLISIPFWQVFAVFFPAVTGIEAGIAMSGDLKNPKKSLPLGTIAAVLVSYVIYLVIALFLDYLAPPAFLKSNLLIMSQVALIPILVFIGIWGATLSSALGALLGAPRTLQALALDRVFPQFIGKGFGKQNDPRIATAISFLIAAFGLSLGSLDVIAPVLSMFFLTSYGSLNLIAGLEGLINNPSWRPSFRTPWYVSFIGAFGCFATMLMINPGAAFIAFTCCISVYLLMRKRRLKAGWSDMRRSILIFLARASIYRLAEIEHNAKTWRPNLLVLSGSPTSRWYLIELADAMSHGKGFLTVASIVNKEYLEQEKILSLEKSIKEYLFKRKVPSLVKVKYSKDFVPAVEGLVHDYGLGPIKPNTIVFGETEKEENFIDYAYILTEVYQSQKNLLIIREGKKENNAPKVIRQKQIDVWWGRQHNNATLMLALAYLLQTSPEWMGSRLILKSLVKSEEERQGVMTSLIEFSKESRIEAGIEVYVGDPKVNSFHTIEKYSKGANLVFLGMRPPMENESAHDYSEYYEQLLENTKDFPTTIITLAGEKISFKDIFD